MVGLKITEGFLFVCLWLINFSDFDLEVIQDMDITPNRKHTDTVI